jgi:hypothetical protein
MKLFILLFYWSWPSFFIGISVPFALIAIVVILFIKKSAFGKSTVQMAKNIAKRK